MRILRNYILKELAAPFVISLTVLIFVLLMGNLIKLAELVITKGVHILAVGALFLYLIPYLLSYALPMAVLTGCLLTFGRLSSDNEVATIRASGINLYRLILPVTIMGIILSLISIFLNDQILPKSHFASRKVLTDIGIKKPTAYLEAGTFIRTPEGYILFIYGIEENKLSNVRVYEPQEGGPARTIIAKRGEFIPLPDKKTIKLKLMDGTSDEPDPKNPNKFYKLNFKTYYLTINLINPESSDIEKKPRDMTLKELSTKIEEFRSSGIDPRPLAMEFHRKLALSFANLVFVLIGLPLAIVTKRREKSIGFGLAFLVIVTYYLLSLAAEALSIQGILPPNFSMWIPNLLFAGIGMLLLYRTIEG